MREYFNNIYTGVLSFLEGLSLTFKHLKNKEDLVATLQYPNEKWPIPDRNIGYDNSEYNVIRSRLHVDMDDCIGCLQCERACPVDCIKIDTIKPAKDSEFDCGVTSLGTQKKLVVPRFTIDMSECMYCNLCVYPCPEECIYMVGGPNADKHEIDYEFSQYSRDGLIFEFANATDQDILSVGGKDYIEKRDQKKIKLIEGEKLQGVEELVTEQPSDIQKSKEQSLSGDSIELSAKSFNVLEDKMQRGLIKKIFIAEKKKGLSDLEILTSISRELKKSNKLTEEVSNLLKSLSSGSGTPEKNTSKPSGLFDLKLLNDIEDKMVRGLSKKIYIQGKKAGKSSLEIIDDIENELNKTNKLDDSVRKILTSIKESA